MALQTSDCFGRIKRKILSLLFGAIDHGPIVSKGNKPFKGRNFVSAYVSFLFAIANMQKIQRSPNTSDTMAVSCLQQGKPGCSLEFYQVPEPLTREQEVVTCIILLF